MPFTKLEAHLLEDRQQGQVRDGSLFGRKSAPRSTARSISAATRSTSTGTFVPLYGVNNLFSQIPLFGPILGGGAHEGLFGLNYRITGSAGAPVLNVNPLSAMAPGFLRKIFGAIDGAAQGPDRAARPRQRSAAEPDRGAARRGARRPSRSPSPELTRHSPATGTVYSGLSRTCFLRPSDSLMAPSTRSCGPSDGALVRHHRIVHLEAAALDLAARFAGRGHQAGPDEGRQHADAGLELGRGT